MSFSFSLFLHSAGYKPDVQMLLFKNVCHICGLNLFPLNVTQTTFTPGCCELWRVVKNQQENPVQENTGSPSAACRQTSHNSLPSHPSTQNSRLQSLSWVKTHYKWWDLYDGGTCSNQNYHTVRGFSGGPDDWGQILPRAFNLPCLNAHITTKWMKGKPQSGPSLILIFFMCSQRAHTSIMLSWNQILSKLYTLPRPLTVTAWWVCNTLGTTLASSFWCAGESNRLPMFSATLEIGAWVKQTTAHCVLIYMGRDWFMILRS